MKWVDSNRYDGGSKLVAEDGEILGEVSRSFNGGWVAMRGLGWVKPYIDEESAKRALENQVSNQR